MRTHSLLPALAAALALAAPAARADQVHGSRSEKLVEKAHWVAVHLDRGHADLVVHRTLYNGGARHDQATLWIDVPEEAVAVDLRTLSVKDDKPIWYRADLMEAEAAAARYRELTGVGGYYPKDPALLSWRHRGLLALQVFPVPPAQPKTVEYTLSLPTHYRRGRHVVSLPLLGTEALRPRLVVDAAGAGDRVFIGDRRVPSGTGFTPTQDLTDLSIERRDAPPLDGALCSVPMGKDRVLSHLRIEAAPRVSEAPRGARVAVVIDASRSFPEEDRRAGIAAVRAMLSHFAGAQVEIITFDREPHASGRFIPAAAASATLSSMAIAPKNGSAVDAALALADAHLAKLSAGIPKRIVLVTDLLTRSSLTPDRVRLRSGAILHIGVMDSLSPQLARDDDHPWSAVARATTGLLWRAGASAAPVDAETMKQVYEEWARPVRIHHFKIDARGLDRGALDAPEDLPEGDGVEDLRVNPRDVTSVVVSGELWSKPVRVDLRPDDGEARVWSALAFGAPEIDLTEPEMTILAKRGHAVSPVTSLLAVEPGVRPSTEGFEEEGFGAGGGGLGGGIGLGSIGTLGHGSISGFDPEAYLKKEIGKALHACGGSRPASVTLETTLDEIADVPEVTIDGAAAPITRCLREGTWAIDLPPGFNQSFQRWTIAI